MPRIAFTHHLRRHAPAEPLEVAADTPRAALEAVFALHPALRGYVLDEQGGLRRHVALFVDGELRRDALDAPVAAGASIYVMQALSGG
ncbi:thiamine biosynthesis protein ThiS [Chitinimonas koreensis]|uniref:thiamine biosynthesis protein ThiS n=1 Tax=Chitinimonas koreensis TaxID=356302 RepID=UPI0004100871|nr:thiamine biosynthesis protein ThiS [Chitinimonas koreensis]QNM96125.1 MoaD/ThiS family protein [Chitinimonas koreensis]